MSINFQPSASGHTGVGNTYPVPSAASRWGRSDGSSGFGASDQLGRGGNADTGEGASNGMGHLVHQIVHLLESAMSKSNQGGGANEGGSPNGESQSGGGAGAGMNGPSNAQGGSSQGNQGGQSNAISPAQGGGSQGGQSGQNGSCSGTSTGSGSGTSGTSAGSGSDTSGVSSGGSGTSGPSTGAGTGTSGTSTGAGTGTSSISGGTGSSQGTQTSQGGSGSIANITFSGGTAQQQQQVKNDYQTLMQVEGPFMTSGQENQPVSVTFDNTPGGLTSGNGSSAQIQLNSNLGGSELDAVAAHEFNNAYKSSSFNPGNSPNSLGYFPSEYIGDALARQALNLPEDTHGNTVLQAGQQSGLSLAQMYGAYFGDDSSSQQFINAVQSSGVFNSTTQ